jgi:putrescine transport system substrate-binding protein
MVASRYVGSRTADEIRSGYVQYKREYPRRPEWFSIDVGIAPCGDGDIVHASNRAREAKNGSQNIYVRPEEELLLRFSRLALPRDATHAANAHTFIDYLTNPRVIAKIPSFMRFANASSAASLLLNASIVADPAVYPPP